MANNGWYKLDPSYSKRRSESQNKGMAPNKGSQMPKEKAPLKTELASPPPKQMEVAAAPESPILPLKTKENAASAPKAPPKKEEQKTAILPVPSSPKAEKAALSNPQTAIYHKESDHSLTVGERGPVLLQDTMLHETLESFVNGTTLSRVVHTKGFGAYGYFQTTNSMKAYTKASLFQTAGTQVPVLTRFSLAVSNPGTPDSGRNVRGFSTKFYTEEGIFDLLCNHIPVFLVRDAIRFPDSIRAFLPSPKNNLADPDIFWGFVATAPEATHFVTWLYSDVGTLKSLRHIHASSVNTYVWRNAEGVRRYVKYHWIPQAGEQYIDREEAVRLAGENPDVAGRDLFDTIAKGTPVEYELRVQIMEMGDAPSLPYDPLDDTKTWDENSYPLLPVGKLVLNRNPESFTEQIEKVAFSPANLLDGIELSDDKMLQGRSTIYWDAQRHRLGNEFRKIPVNKQPEFHPEKLVTTGEGQYVEGQEMRAELSKPDNFTQAGQRYDSLTEMAQANLVDNIASELYLVAKPIQEKVLAYLTEASAELGERVRAGMQGYSQGGDKAPSASRSGNVGKSGDSAKA